MAWKFFGGAAASAFAALALAATAAAATPFNVGPGTRPDIKVDAQGKAHIAWIEHRAANASSPGQVHYCRIAVGATTCEAKAVTGPPDVGNYPQDVHGPVEIFLNPVDGSPRVFTGCLNCHHGGGQTSELVVAPAGTTITRRTAGTAQGGVIGNMIGTGISAYDPATDRLYAANAYQFQRMPTADPANDTPATISPFGGGSGDRGGVGRAGGVQVAAFIGRGLDSGTRLRFLTHAGEGDDINTAASWQGGDTPLDHANDLAIESAASGVTLLTVIGYSQGAAVKFRRFDPATRTFLAPVTIASKDATGDTDPSMPDLFEAPNGRLYATWFDSKRIRYSTSVDGVTWSTPENLVVTDTIYDLHIAGNGEADKGFVTWDTDYSRDGIVKAAPLSPVLTITCPGDPRCPKGPGTQQPQQQPQPPADAPTFVRKRGTIRQLAFEVKAPSACVPRTTKLNYAMAFKKRVMTRTALRKLRRKMAKVRKIALTITNPTAARTVANRNGSSLTGSTPVTGAAGSVYKLSFKVTYREGRSKKNRTKTVALTVKVC